MEVECLKCKGRGFCGRSFCPLVTKAEALYKVKQNLKKDFSGSSPAVFVGRVGYPMLNVGIMAPPDVKDSSEYDSPKLWSSGNYDIPSIVNLRSGLVNSKFKAYTMEKSKFLDVSREVAMASKPVDMEFNLDKVPNVGVKLQADVAPMGPSSVLQKVSVMSNPSIDTRVERVVDDDLKATDAVYSLYSKGFDENFLSKLLSVGNLGFKKDRKLVPTRWSITATDDLLGKELIKEIQDFNEYGYYAYFGGYLGNYYLCLFFPDIWSYELFEMYMPKASFNSGNEIDFTTDYESFRGRSRYAQNCAGGYYSVRLGVLEKLRDIKRKGSCLVFRFITDEYAVPLGVWVTRESTRLSLSNKPIEFATEELMLNYAKLIASKKFGADISSVLSESILIKDRKSQSKLSKWF